MLSAYNDAFKGMEQQQSKNRFSMCREEGLQIHQQYGIGAKNINYRISNSQVRKWASANH